MRYLEAETPGARSALYHAIMTGYLEHAALRGFEHAHIWVAPPEEQFTEYAGARESAAAPYRPGYRSGRRLGRSFARESALPSGIPLTAPSWAYISGPSSTASHSQLASVPLLLIHRYIFHCRPSDGRPPMSSDVLRRWYEKMLSRAQELGIVKEVESLQHHVEHLTSVNMPLIAIDCH